MGLNRTSKFVYIFLLCAVANISKGGRDTNIYHLSIGQLWNTGDIRSNNVVIECSLSFLSETHNGETSISANGTKEYWSDLHGAWTQISPDACDNSDATLLNFRTTPKEVLILCPKSLSGMKKTLKRLLDWENYLTRGVEYSVDVFTGSLSSVLFNELSRTSNAGRGTIPAVLQSNNNCRKVSVLRYLPL